MIVAALVRRTLQFIMIDMAVSVCFSGALLLAMSLFLWRRERQPVDPAGDQAVAPSAVGVVAIGLLMLILGTFGLLETIAELSSFPFWRS